MPPRVPQEMPDLLRHLDLTQSIPEIDVSEKPVFLSIDLEAYEFAQNKITEIGISVFDTRNCSNTPIVNADSWLSKITTRHLIIKEYKHLVNKIWIKGCPGKFNFGVSEVVRLQDVGAILADIFTNPIPGVVSPTTTPRKVIIVGHGLKNDTDYLQTLGFSLAVYSNVVSKMDTQTLGGGTKKAQVGLEKLLLALGVHATNLHNAGNDAAYTLQALLLIGYQYNVDPNALSQAITNTPNPVKYKNIKRQQYKAKAAAAQALKSGSATSSSAGVNLGTAISAPAQITASNRSFPQREVEMLDALSINPTPATSASIPTEPTPEMLLSKGQRARRAKQLRKSSGNGVVSSPGEVSTSTQPMAHTSKVEKPHKKTVEERKKRSLEHHGGTVPEPRLTRAKRGIMKTTSDAEEPRLVAGDDELNLSFRPLPPRTW